MRISKLCLLGIFLTVALMASAQKDTTRIVLLSVNDMHAKIDNFPRFKSLVDSIKGCHENVLLLSAGDIFTGNPVVDQYPDKGYPMIQLMNLTGFNASALGNHEFDYGQDVLAKRIAQAEFPILCANIFYNEAPPLDIKPYVIIKLGNGVSVGILGLIQINEAGLPDSHPSRLSGISFKPGIEVAPDYKWLADSCNIVIGLSHLGFETDVEVAEKMGTFDVIIGGHTHTLVSNPREYNDVLIVQSGSGLKYVTLTTICLVDKKVVGKKAQILEVQKHQHTDATLDSLLAQFNDNKELNEVIGAAIYDISGNDELGSLMTDAMTSIEPLEIAFQNNGGIRVDQFPQGDISIKDVYKLDPFGNEIIHFRMSIKEIKSLIVNSFNREKELDLQVSGLNYTVFINSEGVATDAEITLPDGSTPDEARLFETGLSSYIASSYTFDHADEGTSLYTITAQSLINYIKKNKAIEYKGVKRAFVKQVE
ncbi:MAG: bifunctional UDP-sugar hydrolase/5'-nucleotidase [Lentimicrobium sp.]|jgi:2',3'-cyclic-nucleotide 2'-phosphodiesterase (5'-nucleotidase family)|nr:bifunctional UDP-sugar hydrolase/5'-nucleotidase [Lentimicrobium sp.]